MDKTRRNAEEKRHSIEISSKKAELTWILWFAAHDVINTDETLGF